MKKVVNRSGWGTKRKVLQDIKHLPLFVVGQAPRYDGEYSGTFEGEPMEPLYGGWMSLWILIALALTCFAGYHIALLAIQDYQSGAYGLVSITIGILTIPFASVVVFWLGSIVAQAIAFPFLIANLFFDRGAESPDHQSA